MRPLSHLDHIRADGAALLDAARKAPHADVPSCPGWTMVDLVAHTGRVHRWVTEILRTKPDKRIRFQGQIPSEIDASIDWFAEGLDALLATLDVTDPDTRVWNWAANAPGPAGFWFRRMAQETVIHRCDAEAAAGLTSTIDTALAVDGIDEWLGIVEMPDDTVPPRPGLEGTLTVSPVDADARWHVRLSPEAITRVDANEGGDEIRGAASDVYLWLLHREPATPVELRGPGQAVEAWKLVRFE